MHKSALRYILLAALFMALMAGSAAAQTKQVAIIPFTVHAEKDLSYLAQGAADMMGSRLSASANVTPVDMAAVRAGADELERPLSREAVRRFGKQLDADYVLYGSITMLGGHVSIDTNVVDVTGDASPVSFYRQADTMAGVIPAVNDIAGEIGRKVFSASPARSTAKPAPSSAGSSAAPSVVPPVPSPYVHPEKLLDGNVPGGGGAAGETTAGPVVPRQRPESPSSSNSPFVVTGKSRQERGFWKSRDYEMELIGMAVADVDGDGKNETVLIDDNYLAVRRMERGRFFIIAEREGASYRRNLAVDAVDTDGNGKAEIFVTCLNENSQKLCSYVCTVSGRSLDLIAEDQPWYFRAKGEGVIAGQKKGMSGDVFLPGIYRLMRNGDTYVQQAKIPVPAIPGLSVYDYAKGGILDNGNEQIVVMTEDDRLKVYSQSGDMLWKSRDRFGGSETYITVRKDSENELGDRRYLSQRIYVADVNNDGRNEVLTVVNESVSGRLFSRFKHYSGLKLVCLGWDGLGLSEMWHTRTVSGYGSDFSLADIDNDGKNEAAAVVVSAREAALSTPRSSVISYDLEGAK
ncbi:MAG: VCBS repeat-containing protein [Thermodesulfobacteriota bacterium]|nr:VCBS repeat-containing protein [Thermodesulfobacteriota bacterium]